MEAPRTAGPSGRGHGLRLGRAVSRGAVARVETAGLTKATGLVEATAAPLVETAGLVVAAALTGTATLIGTARVETQRVGAPVERFARPAARRPGIGGGGQA